MLIESSANAASIHLGPSAPLLLPHPRVGEAYLEVGSIDAGSIDQGLYGQDLYASRFAF
jgi:hypothetical protein